MVSFAAVSDFPTLPGVSVSNQTSSEIPKNTVNPQSPYGAPSHKQATPSSPPAETLSAPVSAPLSRNHRSEPYSSAATSTSEGFSKPSSLPTETPSPSVILRSKSTGSEKYGNSTAPVGTGIPPNIIPTSTAVQSTTASVSAGVSGLQPPLPSHLPNSRASAPPYSPISKESGSALPGSQSRGSSGLFSSDRIRTRLLSSAKLHPTGSLGLQSPHPTGSRYPIRHSPLPTGPAGPYKASTFGQPNYRNSSLLSSSAKSSGYASGITLGTGFMSNATQASTIWGRDPACTASWKSRVSANNGTVMTTKVYSRTISLPTQVTSTWAVSEFVTGPTTEVITAGKCFSNISHTHKIHSLAGLALLESAIKLLRGYISLRMILWHVTGEIKKQIWISLHENNYFIDLLTDLSPLKLS